MADDPDQVDWAWIRALHILDGLGNKQPLGELLCSDVVLSPLIRRYLWDLIERGVDKPSGHPRTPAYTLSDKEGVLLMASEEVRYHVKERGKSVAEAVEIVASQCQVEPDHLADYYKGRHQLSRRRRRAKPPRTAAAALAPAPARLTRR